MSNTLGPYQVVDLSPGRQADGPIPAIELEVVEPEQKARAGEALSFTGFLVHCLARAVDENKEVQAYLKGRKQLVMFDDVNVGLMVEQKHGETRALMGHIIKAANRKTYREIHEEIRSVQSNPAPRSRGMPTWFRSAMRLPWPLSKLVKSLLGLVTRRDPTIRVAASGTVVVTAVGMFGKDHSGWGIATMPVSLSLVVGSIAWKPAVVEGRIEPREVLNLTVLFDHDVVDGAPAARFTSRLMELIESGYGLVGTGASDSSP